MDEPARFRNDVSWRSKIDPGLLESDPPVTVREDTHQDIAAEAGLAPGHIFIPGSSKKGANGGEEEDVMTLESILPGISSYLSTDRKVSPRTKRTGPPHTDKTSTSTQSSSPAVASLANDSHLQLTPSRPIDTSLKQRRAKTIHVSCPGQNPQRLWEEKQRRDSLIESVEKPQTERAEYDGVRYEEVIEEVVDYAKQRWETFVRESRGQESDGA